MCDSVFLFLCRVVTSWIDTREIQSERANLTILFDKYLPPILDTLRIRFKKIIPIPGKKKLEICGVVKQNQSEVGYIQFSFF